MPLFEICSSIFGGLNSQLNPVAHAKSEIAEVSGAIVTNRRHHAEHHEEHHEGHNEEHDHQPRDATSSLRKGRHSRGRSKSRGHKKSHGGSKSGGHKNSRGGSKSGSKNNHEHVSYPRPSRMELSIADEGLQEANDPETRAMLLNRVKALGAGRIRVTIQFDAIDPCLGPEEVNSKLYHYDELIKQAAEMGIKTEMSFTGVNANWGKPACRAVPNGQDPDPKEIAETLRVLIPHYAELGVDRFTPWNEPNNPMFLCGVSGGEAGCKDWSQAALAKKYGEIYLEVQDTFEELKKDGHIGKHVQLQIGELSPRHDIPTFLEHLFDEHSRFVADGFTVHPYQLCTPPDSTSGATSAVPKDASPGCFGHEGSAAVPDGVGFGIGFGQMWQKRLAELHQSGRLQTSAGKQVPLYYNEFGYMTNWDTIPESNAEYESFQQVPEDTRALWTQEALDKARRDGAFNMLIYQFMPGGAIDGFDSSILHDDCTPTPTFLAIREWAQKNGYEVGPLPTDSCPGGLPQDPLPPAPAGYKVL